MNFICKCVGGSHLYGLNGPDSDIDWRGIYLNTSVSHILGLKKDESFCTVSDEKDESYHEFRHFLKLSGSNTQCLELLFNQTWFQTSQIWQEIQFNKYNLIDSVRLFGCLRGYMQGERKLAFGERTGKLGGKRYAQLEKYGYSPKNIVQLFRLAWAGKIFFDKNYFPVSVKKEDSALWTRLMNIKFYPEDFKIEELAKEVDEAEKKLVESFESRKKTHIINESVVNELCLKAYGPFITNELKKIDVK